MKKLLLVLMVLLTMLAGCDHQEGEGSFSAQYYPNCSDNLVDFNNNLYLDLDHINEGYFAVNITCDCRYVVQVVKDGDKYNYFVNNNEITYITFTEGSGDYVIRFMKNTSANKYVEAARQEVSVELEDEFLPFLHSNSLCVFDENSVAYKKAAQLAAKSSDDADLLYRVYEFICSTLKYDDELAATVKSGYIPDPDRTLANKKGICYDYASLACAMLRSQGVPCKLVTGYYGSENVFHSWNMVYLKERGWVAFEYSFGSNSWGTVDITLGDSNDPNYLKNKYSDAYVY